MGRSIKERCISCVPVASYYKPVGIPMRNLDEIVLAMDELEAMRLTDLEGLYQADAAERMGVSRQTIGNTLNSAHRKLADALINGKALRIESIESIERSANTAPVSDQTPPEAT